MELRRSKKFLVLLAGVMFLLIMVPLGGYAEVPQQVNYQGSLADSDGNPVPDDDYNISFAIYSTPSGGTALWGESQTVAVTNGIYNVILGQPGNAIIGQ